MRKHFMSWRERNVVEKAATVVTAVGLSGGVAILFLRHFIIAFVVVTITVVAEFVLLRIAKKRRNIYG